MRCLLGTYTAAVDSVQVSIIKQLLPLSTLEITCTANKVAHPNLHEALVTHWQHQDMQQPFCCNFCCCMHAAAVTLPCMHPMLFQRRKSSDSKYGLYDSGILFKPHMLPAAVVCSLMQDLCSMQDSDVTPSIMPGSTFFLAAAWDAKRPPQVTFETGCKLAKQSL